MIDGSTPGWTLVIEDDDGDIIWASNEVTVRKPGIARFGRLSYCGLLLIVGPVTTRDTGCNHQIRMNTLLFSTQDRVAVDVALTLADVNHFLHFGPL